MKDIGYYAGFLNPETQEEIRQAPLWQLSLTLTAFAQYFSDTFYYDDDSITSENEILVPDAEVEISDRDKLSLIRGLCDRIEAYLMEQAK